MVCANARERDEASAAPATAGKDGEQSVVCEYDKAPRAARSRPLKIVSPPAERSFFLSSP